MKIIISPAKKLDFQNSRTDCVTSKPKFLEKSEELINILKEFSSDELSQLMGISSSLADLNVKRFSNWSIPFASVDVNQAIFAFQGDVYKSMQPDKFNNKELEFTQNNIRILSGLYGILKPFDVIMPYRLEMGTRLATSEGKNLYDFWGNLLTKHLDEEMKEDESLINLASDEYSKSVNIEHFGDKVITPVFKDTKNGVLKVISFFAKKARGYMCRFIIENQLTHEDQLLDFNLEGYKYSKENSDTFRPVFIR